MVLPPSSSILAPSVLSSDVVGPAFTARDADPAAMPWRGWLSSCMAVVMLAARSIRAEAYTLHQRSLRLSAADTLVRLAACAPALGLVVVMRLPLPQQQADLLVLGPSADETAVIQRGVSDSLLLPLTLHVRATEDGGAEVSFHGAGLLGAHALSQEVRELLVALPRLVETALDSGEALARARPVGPAAALGLRRSAAAALDWVRPAGVDER